MLVDSFFRKRNRGKQIKQLMQDLAICLVDEAGLTSLTLGHKGT